MKKTTTISYCFYHPLFNPCGFCQTPYAENARITDLPGGVSYQKGPGSNNSLGWTYPYGTKLVVNSGV